MNGAAGERRKGRSVTALTVKDCPANAVATEVASSSTRTRTAALARLLAVLVEVLAGGHRGAAERDEGGAERGGARVVG